ncbi:MAG: AI-2E family transporter [Candidatus Krumholzibacteriia bacterium]
MPGQPAAPDRPPPLQMPGLRTSAAMGTFLLLLFTGLFLARGFVLPILIAVILSLLLSPVVRALTRLRIPESLGAFLVIVGFLVALGVVTVRLAGPAASWMEETPRHLRTIEYRLRHLKEPMEKVARASKQVEELADMDGEEPRVTPVEVRESRLSTILLSGTREFLATSVAVLILLYFLLASGDLFLRKLVVMLPTLRDKRRAVEVAQQVQREVSRYLLAVTVINAGLAAVVSVALALLGMPNPVLWGVLAGLLNYVPFIGPVVTFSVITVVSLLSFDSAGRALVVPLVYGAINFTEGNLMTPLLLGRHLVLNPVAIFVALMFWGWLWGIPGALLAVPLLAIFKIICDNLAPLQPLGEFLGR